MAEVPREHTGVVIRSIDDYLGPSSQRFFGSGYKRSSYQIQPHMDDDKLSATVDVSYPADWSLKQKGADLRPHLSTVDVMILGVRSAETLLHNVLGLTPNQIELATIQKLVVRAGTRPEESLEGLQLSAEIKKTVTATNSNGRTTDSTVVAQVGVMQATVVVRHETPHARQLAPPNYSYLIEDSDGYWGAGYRYGDQIIENVVADIGALSAEAEVNVFSELSSLPRPKSSHSLGFVTFIDAFVSLLQLTSSMALIEVGLKRFGCSGSYCVHHHIMKVALLQQIRHWRNCASQIINSSHYPVESGAMLILPETLAASIFRPPLRTVSHN